MTTGLTSFSTEDDPEIPSLLSTLSETTAGETEPGMSSVVEDVEGPGAEAGVHSDAESWRSEVAARLQRYRTRRKPSSPRYPSLLLPFDPPQYRYHSSPPAAASESTTQGGTTTESKTDLTAPCNQFSEVPRAPEQAPRQQLAQFLDPYLETSAQIIEFPRSAAIPVLHASDLADPVIDRPRIVEAPEVLPPPPALGGMLMEPVRNRASERSDEFGSLTSPASIVRRWIAFLLDGVILGSALAAFAAVFLRLNLNLSHERGSLLVFIEAFGAVTVVVWMIYDFLFLVYTGSTPGLRAARLQLASFDGTPIDRRLRRWRVVTSFLSAFSAGLGYAWCLLDEKGLCWHDRITRTYVQTVRK
jgi:uncharacterized RDD family membrane protein YckC